MATRRPLHRPTYIPEPAASADRKRVRDRLYDEQRASPSKRGYGVPWIKARAAYLASRPLCADCEAKGLLVKAEQVHHIQKIAVRPDLALNPSNLMGLCSSCHGRRSARGE